MREERPSGCPSKVDFVGDRYPNGRSEKCFSHPHAIVSATEEREVLAVGSIPRSFQRSGLHPHERKKTYKSSQR